ncbi:hypothetical protein SHIRM173S_02381 [Streptomyces hirsutus]
MCTGRTLPTGPSSPGSAIRLPCGVVSGSPTGRVVHEVGHRDVDHDFEAGRGLHRLGPGVGGSPPQRAIRHFAVASGERGRHLRVAPCRRASARPAPRARCGWQPAPRSAAAVAGGEQTGELGDRLRGRLEVAENTASAHFNHLMPFVRLRTEMHGSRCAEHGGEPGRLEAAGNARLTCAPAPFPHTSRSPGIPPVARDPGNPEMPCRTARVATESGPMWIPSAVTASMSWGDATGRRRTGRSCERDPGISSSCCRISSAARSPAGL